MRALPGARLTALVRAGALSFVPAVDNATVHADMGARLRAGAFARVPVLVGSNEREVGDAAVTRAAFTCPAARVARWHARAWQYRYFGNWTLQAGAPAAGAFHGSEIANVFGTYQGELAGEEQRAASRFIQGTWAVGACGWGLRGGLTGRRGVDRVCQGSRARAGTARICECSSCGRDGDRADGGSRRMPWVARA